MFCNFFTCQQQHARICTIHKTNMELLHRRSILVCIRSHVGVDCRLRIDAQRQACRERQVFSTGNMLDRLCEMRGSCEKTLDKQDGWAGFTRGCIQGRLLGRDANRDAPCRVVIPQTRANSFLSYITLYV